MIDPAQLRVGQYAADDMGGHIRQQFGTGWCAELVIDHGQAFTFTGQAQHGRGKVVAPRGIHPAGSQDQMRTAAGGNRLFAGQLAGAIDTQWRYRISFLPGLVAKPCEHIIGGVMHQQSLEP
ncbi:hypothetical protein D3C76_1009090 [compost metagenome]